MWLPIAGDDAVGGDVPHLACQQRICFIRPTLARLRFLLPPQFNSVFLFFALNESDLIWTIFFQPGFLIARAVNWLMIAIIFGSQDDVSRLCPKNGGSLTKDQRPHFRVPFPVRMLRGTDEQFRSTLVRARPSFLGEGLCHIWSGLFFSVFPQAEIFGPFGARWKYGRPHGI